VSRSRPADGVADPSGREPGAVGAEELRRRSLGSVAADALYLFTTGFFGHLVARGFWPAVIAAVPLAALLYFGANTSRAFLAAQIAAAAAAAAATYAGPL